MNEISLKNVIEAALLAAGRPVELAELAALFDEALRPTSEQVRAALAALAADYLGRGIEVKETATGFRVQVRRELAAEISRLWPERPARYSRALLETLALIAYRQPITRGDIEAVRGVAVNPNIVKTLLERNWIRIVGHRDVPGRPELLGTTREFLDYFGLKSLDELPPLAELKAMADLNVQLDFAPAGRGSDVQEASPGDAPAEGPEEGIEEASALDPDALGHGAGDELDDEEDASSEDPESSAGLVARGPSGSPIER
ncbi:MAG TPA: SMC-Scp complex subunit ScpB [Steroidobacteraceae bacterium]|jgi:segregation and condensation protein B|nr:SMC-Scp complex subunit ScpB [Steroidobacteraceae bacterium]